MFDLVDNRLLAHWFRGGGLYVVAGSAGFARYAEGAGWQLAQMRGRVPVAMLRKGGRVRVPLGDEPGGSISMAVYANRAGALKVSINGKGLAQDLARGWQVVSFDAGADALRTGENTIDVATQRPVEVAWMQIGGTPDDVALPPGNASFVESREEGRDLVLAEGDEVVYYLYVPERAVLQGQVAGEPVGASCRVVVRARTEGAGVDGELGGDAGRIDLDALAGQVARLSLRASGCPRALLQGGALALPGSAAEPRTGPPPRHVILWIMDTLRADRVRPVRPDARPEVPALERMAAEGAVFRQAYVQGNESQTSHASMWTSVFPAVHGVRTAGQGGTWRVSPRFNTVGQLARSAGLAPVAVTANGMITTDAGYSRGFGSFVNLMRENDPRRRNGWVPGERILSRALKSLERRWEQRFLLFIGTIDTHKPWVGHQPWLARYDPDPYEGPFETAAWPGDLGIKAGRMACTRPLEPRDLARVNAIYDSAVSYQDQVLGAMLDELDRRGVADETMIIVTADHGEELWEAGRCGHGASLLETLVHVPLFVRYPPLIPPGTVVEEGVDALDILPTLADALGARPLRQVQGQSLIPLAQGIGRGYPRPSYASQYEYAHALRVGSWKMWRGARGGAKLYDLAGDPGERAAVPDAERPIERRFMTDLFRLFVAQRSRWSKSRWGVVSNMSPHAADALDRHMTRRPR